jgi:uncharacterized membrane protein YciS (DUF1049 family)
MNQKPISNIVAGLIIGAIVIIYSIILSFSGLQANQSLSWLTYLILIIGVIYFVIAYGKANNDNVTFGNLFAYGFKVTAVVAILFIVFEILFNLLFPEFREKMYDLMRQKFAEQGKLSEDQINTAIEMTKKFFMIGLIAGSAIFFSLFGVIAGLIGAAMAKKNPVAFENQV